MLSLRIGGREYECGSIVQFCMKYGRSVRGVLIGFTPNNIMIDEQYSIGNGILSVFSRDLVVPESWT